jgi:hypothetical protein
MSAAKKMPLSSQRTASNNAVVLCHRSGCRMLEGKAEPQRIMTCAFLRCSVISREMTLGGDERQCLALPPIRHVHDRAKRNLCSLGCQR